MNRDERDKALEKFIAICKHDDVDLMPLALELENIILPQKKEIERLREENECLKGRVDELEKKSDELENELESVKEMHNMVSLYSPDIHRRALGDYTKLPEQTSDNAPVYKQNGGTYTIRKEENIWRIGDVSFEAESHLPVPPVSGWKDADGEAFPSLTVHHGVPVPCKQITINFKNGGLSSVLGSDYTGLFSRLDDTDTDEDSYVNGRPIFKNEKNKFLSLSETLIQEGTLYMWIVHDHHPRIWKKERREKKTQWFTLNKRLGVCPSVKRDQKKKGAKVEEKEILFKAESNKYTQEMDQTLWISCSHHGQGQMMDL
jgi:hypothetical protein